MLPRAAGLLRCGLIALSLLALLGGGGCVRWRPVALEAVRSDAIDLRLRRVRAEGPDGRTEFVAHRIAWPQVDGHDLSTHTERRYDLSQARQLWVRGFDPSASGLLVGGVYAAILAISWIAIIRQLPGISGP